MIVILMKVRIQKSQVIMKNWTPVFTGETTFYETIMNIILS